MPVEQQTEWIINNNLVNKGWHIDNDSLLKNVYFQKPKLEEQRRKLNGKKPDYILYQSQTDKPIAIIEAKKGGVDLQPALEQATECAKLLDVPLVFAMNGSYCETRFVPNNKELILNGEEVRGLIREVEVLKFLEENTNEVYTLPKKVILSRNELIKIFKDLNDTLRSEGLRAGIERFSEFANILFLKLLSESEKESYWGFIKKLPDNRLITTINGSIIKEIENKYGGNVFTLVSIQNFKTLRKIIERIDPLVLSTIDTDVKGDAFEYFLKQTTSTNNDLGEYFTPRHIIKTMVNLVAPKFKEKIYDPFCGTGGFLTEAFNYIKENNIIEDKEDLRRLKQETLYGGEITSTARIAKMNMILHDDGHSGIKQVDSLGNPIDGEYDIVITNIPFSQTTEFGSVYYNGISNKNGDSTCVLHCLRSLKKGGRMALVVPEGFLFKSDTKLVREFLLSKAKLQSVISLPQGAFLPYTGVKTDILYLTNAHQTNSQKNYWYFNVKNDGYSLDNHRKRLQGKSDLHKIDESDFKKVEKYDYLKDNLLEVGFKIIDLEKIKKNNYDLRLNQYVQKNYNTDTIPLKKILILKKGKNPKSFSRNSDNALPYLSIDFFEGKNVKYISSFNNMLCSNKDDILIVADGQRSGLVFLGEKGVIASTFYLICNEKKEIIDDIYLYHFIKINFKYLNENKYGSAIPHLDKKIFLDLQIPLIPMEEQLKFRHKQKMIDQKKQEILNLQKKMENDINFILKSEESE